MCRGCAATSGLRRSVWQGPALVSQLQSFAENRDYQNYCGGRELFIVAFATCVCGCHLLACARCIMQVPDLRRVFLQPYRVDGPHCTSTTTIDPYVG